MSAKVSGVTNWVAPAVITTCTERSCFFNLLAISAALYAAIEAVTPRGSGANLKGSASGGSGLNDRTGLDAGSLQGRHFDQGIIILCIRWYLTFKLSSRDLVQMMAERGIVLAHTTILRWVQLRAGL